MSTIYDSIPEKLRREVEARLTKCIERHMAEMKDAMEKLHDAYGDYNDREFEDNLSEVQLTRGKECLGEVIGAWVPLFLAHAPERLDELRKALLTTSPCVTDLKPWHLQELKDFENETFKCVVAECRSRMHPETVAH